MKILTFPKDTGLLRRVARPIRDDEFGTEALLSFADDLGTTMLENKGAGLASTQVREAPGGQPWRMFALYIGAELGSAIYGIVCNPEILSSAYPVVKPEGCLSFASVSEMMKAPAEVTMRFQNVKGEQRTETFQGTSARACFHEEKHLAGALLIDRMGPLQRRMFLKRVTEARKAKP